MTENDPLGVIESDERFLPKEEAPRQRGRGEGFIEHMFVKLSESRQRHGED